MLTPTVPSAVDDSRVSKEKAPPLERRRAVVMFGCGEAGKPWIRTLHRGFNCAGSHSHAASVSAMSSAVIATRSLIIATTSLTSDRSVDATWRAL